MNPSLKVCFMADGHSLYDDRMYWKEALSLQKKGCKVTILLASEEDEQGVTEHGIEYFKVKRVSYSKKKIINYPLKKIYYRTHDEMWKIARSVRADVYHVHDYRINSFIQKIKCLPHRPKLVYDAREPVGDNFKFFHKASFLKKKFIDYFADYLQQDEYRKVGHYDLILTVDNGLKRRFLKNLKNKRVEVLYNYTNQSGERKNIGYGNKDFDAIYCGGISEVRGFYPLLNSTRLIVREKHDYKLLLLGNIFEQELRDYLKNFIYEHKLEHNLIWIDSVRFDQVSDYYNRSRIGLNILYPSDAFKDIIQIKLFEYMNFGLPIVTSNFGEMQNYVLDNQVGMAVDPFDEKQLAGAILELLTDRDKYSLYSENGKKAVDDKYNWKLMEQQLFSWYEELINEKQSH